MANDENKDRPLVAQMEVLHRATESILKAMAIVPENQLVTASVPSGVVFVDKATRSVTANNAAMELFERPLTEAAGEDSYRDLLRSRKGEKLDLSELPSSKALSGKTVLEQELQVERDDGTVVPIRVNAAPVLGAFREIMGAVVVFENVSLEKRLEQMRQQMAATVVHDIRNPVQAVLLNAQAIRKIPSLDVLAAKQARLIEENVGRILVLTNRLPEAARIESAQIKLDLKTVDLGKFVEGVVARASGAYPDRRIDIRVSQQSLEVKLDPERMDQVLTNLLDNAAKYSPKDTEIEVSLSVANAGFDISVRDHGPGIEPDDLVHLFEPYKRAAAGQSTVAGLGLGLFIVKGIVEAHAGTVTVESHVGEGSVFRLHFPSSLSEQLAAA